MNNNSNSINSILLSNNNLLVTALKKKDKGVAKKNATSLLKSAIKNKLKEL